MRLLALALLLSPALALGSDSLPAVDWRAVAEIRTRIAAVKSDAASTRASAKPAAPFQAMARRAKRCRLTRMERRDCVYRCDDGSEYRSPIREPAPHDPGPVIACPQLVFPF